MSLFILSLLLSSFVLSNSTYTIQDSDAASLAEYSANELLSSIMTSSARHKFSHLFAQVKGINELKNMDGRGNSALHLACVNGDFKIFYALKSKYPELIYELNGKNRTSLMLAARNGQTHKNSKFCMLTGLILWYDEMKSSHKLLHFLERTRKRSFEFVNAVDQDGKTALMHAADAERFDSVIVLLKNGANYNMLDSLGRNALFYSILRCDRFSFYLLVQLQNIEYIQVDSDGEDCRERARVSGCSEIVRKLNEFINNKI